MAERAHKWFKMCLLMFIEIFQPIKCFVASIVFTEIMFPLLILFHCHASSFRWFYHVFPYLFVMFQRFFDRCTLLYHCNDHKAREGDDQCVCSVILGGYVWWAAVIKTNFLY
eukprot:1063608_1